ncbi:MAG: hypothetical protein SGPRY_002589, partial [Prymnesium sp.]
MVSPPSDASAALGVAIVGCGRAGRIHLDCLRRRSDLRILYVVDPIVKEESVDVPDGAKLVRAMTEALSDQRTDVVIVATPTPSHAQCIHAALRAKKHVSWPVAGHALYRVLMSKGPRQLKTYPWTVARKVFAEKPLCCEPMEAPPLFEEAERNNVLLFTALNRRHDPQIIAAKAKLESGEMGRPLSVSLLSGDYPYPPEHYLRTCGTLYQDCAIHDFDYVTWLLGEDPVALRSQGSSSDAERSQGTFEHACTHMSFKSGLQANFVHTRIASSYDHRLDITCEKGSIQVVNPARGEAPISFSERFHDSYVAQMDWFVKKVVSGDSKPNITLERTLFLESLSEHCLESAQDKNAEIRLDDPVK